MLAKKGLMTAPAAVAQYVEDVFSTYLYTGNGTSQTITNNIDLSGEGGMTWIKCRNNIMENALFDTNRGTTKYLHSDSTVAEQTFSGSLTAFNSNGFSVGNGNLVNQNSYTFASWTFRKAQKFFDVVTYTGNGTAGRTISHNLGSTPGCIIIKRTSDDSGWAVYHRSLNVANNESFQLNSSIASFTTEQYWNYTAPTSTEITLGNNATVNGNGSSYVAYIFAHDAGGFGEAGDQSVIKCGGFTCDGSGNATIDLGWEPQFVILKRKDATENWELYDNMRGLTVSSGQRLRPSATDAEVNSGETQITNTGFKRVAVAANSTYVYIAIRRGPMKTPESATSVFAPVVGSSLNSSFVTDFAFIDYKPGGSGTYPFSCARLTGNTYLKTSATSAELTFASTLYGAVQNGIGNSSFTSDFVGWLFQRAPGFMDVVTYAGTGSAGATTSHNLGVSPELIITKVRNFSGEDWIVHYRNGSTITAGSLNSTAAFAASGSAPSTDLTNFTSTSYERNTSNRRVNGSYNYVAYLFASLSGISSIGTYTGNGSSVTVTTNFQPRFILVKRTDSTGDWIVSDSARGLIAGNDPYLLLNSTAAEDTDEDWVDISSTGFTVNQVTASNANVNTGTYIYLAIA